jgi:hypothetical protein
MPSTSFVNVRLCPQRFRYYKGRDNGVDLWDARPDVFPSGLAALHQKLGVPLVAHNRWWSVETRYAQQNGERAPAHRDCQGSTRVVHRDYLGGVCWGWGCSFMPCLLVHGAGFE